MESGVSLVSLMFRLTVSMVVVLGLMWVLARVMKNRAGSIRPARGRRSEFAIEVVARQQLGRNMGIAVVKMGTKVYALGMTENQITQLAELDRSELDRSELDGDDSAIDLDGEIQALPRTTGPSAKNWTAALGSSSSGPTWKNALDAMREKTLRR
jgi:flagellar protein FliO/FliZ